MSEEQTVSYCGQKLRERTYQDSYSYKGSALSLEVCEVTLRCVGDEHS